MSEHHLLSHRSPNCTDPVASKILLRTQSQTRCTTGPIHCQSQKEIVHDRLFFRSHSDTRCTPILYHCTSSPKNRYSPHDYIPRLISQSICTTAHRHHDIITHHLLSARSHSATPSTTNLCHCTSFPKKSPLITKSLPEHTQHPVAQPVPTTANV